MGLVFHSNSTPRNTHTDRITNSYTDLISNYNKNNTAISMTRELHQQASTDRTVKALTLINKLFLNSLPQVKKYFKHFKNE